MRSILKINGVYFSLLIFYPAGEMIKQYLFKSKGISPLQLMFTY